MKKIIKTVGDAVKWIPDLDSAGSIQLIFFYFIIKNMNRFYFKFRKEKLNLKELSNFR